MKTRKIKSYIFMFLSIAVGLLAFQNCDPAHIENESLLSQGSNGQNSPAPTDPASQDSISIFAATLHPVLTMNCGGCHGQNQVPRHSLADATGAYQVIIGSNLVDLTTPANSRLVLKIQGGHNGIPAAVAASIQTQVAAWSQGLKDSGAAPPPPVVLEAKFSSISKLIIEPKCVGCHGAVGARGGIRLDTYDRVFAQVGAAAGDDDGELLKVIEDGEMPPAAPLTAAEVSAIRMWIALGAPNN